MAPVTSGTFVYGWFRAGLETGMLSDGPYPVRMSRSDVGRGLRALAVVVIAVGLLGYLAWATLGGRPGPAQGAPQGQGPTPRR